MNSIVRQLVVIASLSFSTAVLAAPLQVRVWIDADRDVATGCASDGFAGAERVVSATLDLTSSGATVSNLAMQRCSDGALGAASSIAGGEGAAGYGAGSGQLLAEFGVPWSSLDLGALPSAIRLGYAAQVGTATDSVFTSGGGMIVYPTPIGRRRVVGINDYMITVDGNGTDWGGLAPLAPGAAAGTSGAVRIENVFAHANATTLWFRVDAKLSGDAPVAVDDAYTVRQGKAVTIATPGVLANDSDPNNKPLSATLATPPNHGTVNLATDGRFTYVHDGTPEPGDSFEYKASNGTQESNKARVALTVTPNGAPDANNDSYSVAHRGTLTIAQPGVLANDSDPDGDTIRAVLVTAPKFGTLTLAQNGSFTYTHNGSNTLSDTFTYRASDGTSQSSSARVTITIGADQAPVGTADAYAVAEGATLNVAAPGVLGNDTDPDTPADLLIANVVTNPAHGALTLNANGSFTYVHDGSETTSDAFTYTVGDGILTSAPITVSITVTPVNDAPVAVADSYTTNEDTPLTVPAAGVLANDTDAENNPLTASLVTNAANGNVVLNANGGFTYTPNANFNGTDSFTYAASDGTSPSNTVTVTITVTAVNDAPSFTAGGNVTVNEDSGAYSAPWATATSAGPADEAGQTLTFNVSNNNNSLFAVQPSIAANGTLTFTPAANANGTATITVTLSDNGSNTAPNVNTSAPQTFTITVNAVNDAPTFVVGSNVTVNEDSGAYSAGQASGMLAGPADEVGQTLTFNVSNDNNGLFAVQPAIAPNGTLTFTPAANASGVATVTVTLSDNGGTANGGVDTSAPQTFTITITGVNDAPVITRPATASVDEDTMLAFTGGNAISIADVDAASGTVSLTLGVSNGTISFGATAGVTVSGDGTNAITASGTLASINSALATLSYTPAAEYAGADTLTIGVNDNGNSGSGGPLSDSQSVAITVNAVNDAPTVSLPGAQTTDEDTPLTFSSGNGNAITVADIDAGGADVSVTLSTTSGTISIGNTAGLTSSTGDGTGSVTITGSVSAINTALEGTAFDPTADLNGAATIDVVVGDGGNTGLGGALQASGTINITINAVNDGPSVSAPGFLNGSEDTAIPFSGANAVTLSDVDSGSGALTLTLQSTNGSVTLASTTGLTVSGDGTALVTASGTLADLNTALNGATFTPAANFSGGAGLDIIIDDNGNTGAMGGSTMDSASTFILIMAVNDAPVATADSYATNEDTPLNVTAPGVLTNDTDVDSGALTAILVTGPSNASSFTLNSDGSFSYTPNANFSGTDSFTYKANDALVDSNVVTVTITVNAVNDAPVITRPLTVTTGEDTPFTFSGSISIADVDGATGSETVTLAVPSGTLTLSGTTGLTVSGNGFSSITATGTVANLNAALNGLVYAPSPEFAGGVTLSIGIDDNGNTGSGGAKSDAKTTNVTITAVNDAPVNSVPGAQAVNEDATLTLSSGNGNAITISDIDAGSADVTVTLSSANGTLTLGGTAGLTTVTGNGTGSVVLTGPITAINTAMNGTVFTPATNFAGTTTINVATNDNGNTGGGGAKGDTDAITVNLTAVNDAPSITRPATATTNEDTPFTFSGGNVISIADVDAASGSITVTLGATNGAITLSGTTNLTVSGNGSNAVTASGALTDINNALNGLVYTSSLNYNGADTLTIGVNDNGNTGTGGALTDSKSVAITINAVNDAPVAVADSYSTNEDTTLNVPAPGVKSNDSDIDSGSFNAVLVTGPASASSFTLNSDGSFSYTSNANFSGSDSFTYKDNDGGLDSNTVTVTITVNAVDDAPVNAMPSSPTMPRDTTLTMTGAGAIQVSDLDAGTNPVQVTLTGGNATMTLSGTAGLTFTTGDGTADASMVFTGAISAINTALDGLQFTPTSGYSGTATLQIVTDDQGFTGSGGPLTDNDTLSVTVLNVNQAPVNTVPGAQGTNEDTPLVFSSGNGNAISISDADAGANPVKITIGVTQGTLTLGGITGLTFTTGDGTADASMVFTGAISAINTALATITYTPNANYNGTDTLTLTTDDQGNTGPGGAKTDTDTVTINIAAVNDGPVAVNDSAYTVFKYTATSNTSLNVASASGVLANDTDVDTPAASLTAILVTGPTHSQSFTLNADGSFTYVPATGYTGTDTFTYKANDGSFDSNVATVTVTVQNHAPTPGTDSFTGVGNTSLEVGVTTFTTPRVHLTGNLLTNDTDADGDTLTITAGTVASANGGSATINADGTFTYTPAANVASDSFTYTVTDGSASNATANGTVNLTLTNKVWYVKNDYVGTSTGTSAQPFTTLAAAQGASATGDFIYVFRGDGTTTGQAAGITLKDNQQLIGEGVALVVNAQTLFPAGLAPQLTSAGNDIQIANGNTIRGLTATGGINGIAGSVKAGLTVANVTLQNATGGISLNGMTGTVTFTNTTVTNNQIGLGMTGGTPTLTLDNTNSITSNATQRSINLSNLGATAVLTIAAPITDNGLGISIANSVSGAQVSFTGTQTLSTTTNNAVNLSTNTGATITFSGTLAITTTTGSGFTASGGCTLNVSNSATITTGAAANALSLNGITVGTGVAFNSVTSTGATTGISLVNTTGTISVNGGTITNGTTGITLQGAATNLSLAGVTITGPTTGITNTTNFGTLTIGSGVSVSGATALNLTTGTISGTFASVSSTGGTNGVSLNAVSGTWGTTGGSLTGSTGATFNVAGSAAAGSAITWGGTITQNNAATAVTIAGHNRNITFNGNITTGGTSTGISIGTSSGTYLFNGTNTVAGSGGGIAIGASESGTITFSNASSINTAGTAFSVAGGGGAITTAITYGGTITKTGASGAGILISVDNLDSPGTLSMTHTPAAAGNITQNNNGANGISVINSSSTNITISDASVTFNNAAAGFTSSANTGATINLPGLALTGNGNKAGMLISGGGTINVSAGAANPNINLSGGSAAASRAIDGATAAFSGTLNLTNVTITGNGTADSVNLGGGTLGGSGSSISGANRALVLSGVALTNGAGITANSTAGTHGVSMTNVTGGTYTIAGALTNHTTAGFFVDGGSPTFTYSGSIKSTGFVVDIGATAAVGGAQTFSGAIGGTAAADGGTGIRVQRASGSVTFSGTQTFGSTGTRQAASAVTLTNNTGTITFSGTLTAATSNTGTAFSATGGGTVVVTGSANTLDALSGTALDITNTTIGASGVKFLSISAGNNTAAADPVNGIVLNNTGNTAGLTVSGSGSAPSGGTIQNVSNVGILLTSTTSPSFNNMNIQKTTSHGVSGSLVNNFSFTNGSISESGKVEIAGRQESNISFYQNSGTGTEKNVTGTVTITGNVLNTALHHGVNITQYDGSITDLNISNNSFQSATASSGSSDGATTSHGTAINVNPIGSVSTIATVAKATLSNNDITGFPGNGGIVFSAGNANFGAPTGAYGSAANPVVIQGNKIRGFSSANLMNTQAINVAINGASTSALQIIGNGTAGIPLGNAAGHIINVSAFGQSTVTADVKDNVIVANNTVGSNGISIGVDATAGFATTTVVLSLTVQNNQVSATNGSGILVSATRNGTINSRIKSNTVGAPASGTYGIQLRAASSSTASGTVCIDLLSNTVAGGTSPGPPVTVFPGIGLRRQSGTFTGPNVFGLVGLSPSPAGTPTVENYVNSQNTSTSGTFGVGGTALASASTGFTSCSLSF